MRQEKCGNCDRKKLETKLWEFFISSTTVVKNFFFFFFFFFFFLRRGQDNRGKFL